MKLCPPVLVKNKNRRKFRQPISKHQVERNLDIWHAKLLRGETEIDDELKIIYLGWTYEES